MTLNNPDENEMVLIRNPNSEYIRQLIWTLEEGEEGTPHVQAYVKLMKQQRQSFIKKLYPRAHFRSITSDEYKHNCHDYAQKNDDTTVGAHVITYNEQIPDVVQFLRKMLEEACGCDPSNDNQPDNAEAWMSHWYRPNEILTRCLAVEKRAVAARPTVAKLLVSPTYTRVKKLYMREIVENIVNALYKQDGEESDSESSSSEQVSDSEVQCDDEQGEEEEASCGDSEGSESEGGDETEY